MPKKNKKEPKYHCDGELPEAVELECENQNIDEIMGNKGQKSGEFGTFDPDKYKKELEDKNLTDVQRECITHGIMPKDRKDYCIERLMRAHAQFASRYELSKIKPKRTPQMDAKTAAFMEDSKSKAR